MKMKTVVAIALAFILLATFAVVHFAETSRTIGGKPVACIDALKEGAIPGVRYELSKPNIIIAVVSIETVIAPVWVLLDATFCPVQADPEGE